MTILDPTPAALATAARLLREGKLVSFPTETVYGLGADATNDEAVASIFAAKGRPQFNPLIVHIANPDEAQRHAHVSPLAQALADRFWPGPLTLVLPRRPDCTISWLATAGLDTIALRCPAHDVAQALLRTFGGPLAAPSANASGSVSATTAQHVEDSLDGAVGLILDGGPARLGLESTIIGLSTGTAVMLRPGAITRARIEEVAGPLGVAHDSEVAPHSPGRLRKHYATAKPLRLDASSVSPGEALLAIGKPLQGALATLNLSETGDLTEAAANLFRMLRALDQTKADGIAVMPIAGSGLGEAINDRLARAAIRD
jgi:L-threonylcarbamoyladenylate synthase